MSTTTTSQTVYQRLRDLDRLTADHTELRRYDSVLDIIVTDVRATLLITTHRYRESSLRTVLTHQGTRMISWHFDKGTVTKTDRTLWDPSWVAVSVDDVTRSVTVDEYTDKLTWDAHCYRPGNGRDFDQVQRETTRAWNRLHGTADTFDSMGYREGE